MMYALPQGKGMEFKLQLSFGNLKKEITNLKDLFNLGKRDFITPTFKVRTESKTYNPLFTPLSQKERREKHEKKVKKRR